MSVRPAVHFRQCLDIGRRLKQRHKKRIFRGIIAVIIGAVTIYYLLYIHTWYVRPSGLVEELFPLEEYVPYIPIKFENGFRYPLELNMRIIAERKLQGEPVNVKTINPHPFRYIYNPKNLCSKYQKNGVLHLLILVKSAAPYVELRHVIRSTWGKKVKEHNHLDTHLEYAFLLGYSDEYKNTVEEEHYLFGDIIQEDFIDAYLNNTHKTIMAYNWAVEYCSHARLVLFLDDDAYLNFDLLNDYLLMYHTRDTVNLFFGSISPYVGTNRNWFQPWYMSWSDFPYDRYPDYLQGAAIFVSMDVVKLFQAIFPYVRFYPFDDVFLGFVAYKLNITPSAHPYMENFHTNYHEHVSYLVVSHGFRNHKYYLQTYNRQIHKHV